MAAAAVVEMSEIETREMACILVRFYTILSLIQTEY